jgi:non-heme chloroperoxidase
MAGAAALILTSAVPAKAMPMEFLTGENNSNNIMNGESRMGTITTNDGTQIFYKDWGPKDAQPVVFHHGWPLSSDD